jgi:hypothetical protein
MAIDVRSKIHHVDECCCFATRDDVTLSVWRGPASFERIQAQKNVLERILRLHDRVYSLTSFRAEDIGMKQFTDDKLRVEFDKLGKLMDGPLAAHAMVIGGTGFVAATIRSAATSMGLLMRNRVSHKIFDDLIVAGRWLPTQRAEGPRPAEQDAVEALLRTMNAQIDARAVTLPAR